MLLVFAFTLFTSATLLFMVEPMIGKMILPLLGGTPAVWNTCMVFFQAVLLAGYAYAHFSTSLLGARKQAALHLVLLIVPFVFLPLAVNRDLIAGGENPVYSLLLLLSLSVGLPMFVVSASAPLLQKWFASTSHPAAKDPYFLYGASNAGSMLALIGYPTLVERYLRLGQQSFDWTIGYGLLVALTALCAVFLWLSPRNVETSEKAETNLDDATSYSNKYGVRGGKRVEASGGRPSPVGADRATDGSRPLSGEVPWLRVLRWVALAFVPSSLMLGATTYITTDIAAIPLLWVTPLALYLLSFIIVFSRVPSWVHKGMVLVMPLLVLGQLFFMISGQTTREHWIAYSLCLHLTTLFVVAMVCHGELARDRPAAKYLTGYFLWMSVGGVLGGLFNALLAPMIFRDLLEYELVMLFACFLAPPLEADKESVWGRRFDMILAGLFVVVGSLLIYLRVRDENLPFAQIKDGPWAWQLAALLLGVGFGVVPALRSRSKKFDPWMDVLLPLGLGLLFVGLSWGLVSKEVFSRIENLSSMLHLNAKRLIPILAYGVPIVLAYTFVERPLRFGLGVGAILLANGFCDVFTNKALHQERSFFGVLRISDSDYQFRGEAYIYRSLNHGTTLHGTQFLHPQDRRDEPLTYYHRSGPIGEVMMAYNGDDTPPDKMNLGVIGLGTGSMAGYARNGQHLTFYDIDPIVKRFSFDKGEEPYPYFTFVQDARERGATLELVLGDARLTMERKQLKDSEKYGVIVVDAFSSDAIPIHLITREAMKVYLDKLTEDGLLCFHISNRYLDLKPVLYNLAQEPDFNLSAVYQNDLHGDDDRSPGLFNKSSSTWVVLSRHKERLDKLLALNDWESKREDVVLQMWRASLWPDQGTGLTGQAMMMRTLFDDEMYKRPAKWLPLEPEEKWPDLKSVGVWTDDYSNLLSVFSW
jgi:hypothetical protein